MSQSKKAGPGIECLESRRLLAGISQVSGIGYLLSDGGTKFQRYDIANQKWLTPITLKNSPGGASASLVDSNGIYVAYGRNVTRYKLDGSTPTHLINAADDVSAIHSDGNLLFLNHSSGLYARFISINKNTNTIIDTMENYVDSIYGSSIATSANKIFGRSQGISPADITYASYDDSGIFGEAGDSPYHGDYADASTTWTFPLGTKVADDSGLVYATSNLTRLNSFGTAIDDIAFVGNDVPIVLHGNKITAYSSTILPTGSKTLASNASQILVNSKNVIAFRADSASSNGYATQIVPLTDLKTATPGAPISPVGLAYTPDHVEIAANGNLLLLSAKNQSIFRWNPTTLQYGSTIPLIDVPKFMAYSKETNTVYLAYASGVIDKIDLSAATLIEKPFVVLPSEPTGLATAGKYLFASDGSGAWHTHYTFAPDGSDRSATDWNYYSTEFIWSPANLKMYFFRDDTSPNDLLSEPVDNDGFLQSESESPLHDSEGFEHPIRVSPDGNIVILGSGLVHDARTLERKTAGLGNSVSDITWMKGTVYTMREIAGQTQFQQWTGSTFAPGAVAQVEGAPAALLTLSDKLLGIYTAPAGIPQFRIMNSSLQAITTSPPPTPSPSITVVNKELRITTGNLDDNISFEKVSGSEFAVVVNGARSTFAYANVTKTSIKTAGGNDTITIGRVALPAKIDAGVGNDQLSGGPAADSLSGGDGTDYLFGADGNDSLVGGNGGDSLLGGANDDRLFPLSDKLTHDVVSGGAGNDTVNYSIATSGRKVVVGATFQDAFSDDVRGDIEVLIGGSGDDNLTNGRAAPMRIEGGAGNDKLTGNSGNDTLLAGAGADRLFGMGGDDMLMLGIRDGSIDKLDGGAGDDSLGDPANKDLDTMLSVEH